MSLKGLLLILLAKRDFYTKLMAGNENEITVHLNGLQKIMAMRNGSFAGFPSHVVEVMLQ
jgi:hypothetical protein